MKQFNKIERAREVVEILEILKFPENIEFKVQNGSASLNIGAEHVRRACVDLIQACEEKHERKVTRALSWLQAEFSITREKLNSLVKMEQRIIRVESRLIK
ncbi:hypothetical protein LOK49_LG14G01127 [Camellia lanceoleosa]|uniref:Uncharacterized protein n=1 Tax=Camellia lanceoleosa TaxID=1840588 RepID=A0ACC0FCV3_9ERIC|nr:hypothetical protein LOK49_LG14G01127 [Camellia lanceoleosa]